MKFKVLIACAMVTPLALLVLGLFVTVLINAPWQTAIVIIAVILANAGILILGDL